MEPRFRLRSVSVLILLSLPWSLEILHAQSHADQVVIHPGPTGAFGEKSTIYELRRGPIQASLKVSRVSGKSASTELLFDLREGGNCPAGLPAAAQFAYFSLLFSRYLMTSDPQQMYQLHASCYTEVIDRMPGLAAKSDDWQRLWHDKNTSNTALIACVARVLNTGNAYSELSKALQPFHYQVRVQPSELEELRSLRVRDLSPQQRRLLSVPVHESDVLPSTVGIFYTLRKD